MATIPKRLINGAELTTSLATYYTAPTSTKAVIKRLVLVNTNAAAGVASSATIHLVPTSGVADDSNVVLKGKVIPANEGLIVSEAEGQVLEPGGTIQAIAADATTITIVASGAEVT